MSRSRLISKPDLGDGQPALINELVLAERLRIALLPWLQASAYEWAFLASTLVTSYPILSLQT